MKNLFLMFAICTFSFYSCTDSDDMEEFNDITGNSISEITKAKLAPFAGTWDGTYDNVVNEEGTFTFEIATDGSLVSGSSYSNIDQSTNDMVSIVYSSGTTFATTMKNGTTVYGTFSGSDYSGYWEDVYGNTGKVEGKKTK